MANRRDALGVILIGGSVVAGFRVIPPLLEGGPEFEALSRPAGFRRLPGGAVSSGFDAFAGLTTITSLDQSIEVSTQEVEESLCANLFGGIELRPGVVPIASFSDYYCPYCRVQTRRLSQLAAGSDGAISIAWHELPLLGEDSMLAARAALAAERQGAYADFHEALLSSPFRANDAYLAELSARIGVDHERLVADLESEAISRQLQTSAALARLFAFVGTPAMVVGRTVIQGEISDRLLQDVIDIEQDEGVSAIC